MSTPHDNKITVQPKEKALEIYNSSINKSTSAQRKCVDDLKSLYARFPSDDVANFYASALFNLSLRVSVKEMQHILEELENLFQKHTTEDIAERIGRIKYNILSHINSNADILKQYAAQIEKLYHQYPTNALAEPLAKIWHSIIICSTNDSLEYVKKIIDLCTKVSDPETNTAYARVLFDDQIPFENRQQHISTFLSNPQALDSIRAYIESPYYPQYNNLFGKFQLCSSYPAESIGKRIDHYFSKLEKSPDFREIKVELLALLYYTFEIRRLLIVPDTSVSIGHYTKLENIKFLVVPEDTDKKPKNQENTYGKLRMSNACYMNDPSEGQTLIKVLSNIITDFADLYNKQSYNIYLSCFTAAIDELPMWSMYGNDGKGCCLVFKRGFFDFTSEEFYDELLIEDRCAGDNNFLFRVVYLTPETNELTIDIFPEEDTNLDQKVADAIRNLIFHLDKICQFQRKKQDQTVNDVLTFILEQIRYLFKDVSYAHEHELRLIRYSESPLLDKESGVVPQLFVEVEKPLEYAQIILGPKVEQTNKITPYLMYTGKVEKVTKSKIKYC